MEDHGEPAESQANELRRLTAIPAAVAERWQGLGAVTPRVIMSRLARRCARSASNLHFGS